MDRAYAPIRPPPRVSRAGHTAEVLSAIYEQDFLPCSFGGRPKLSAHHALATLNEVVAGGMISWVLEADFKNFFRSLSHDWVLRFVEHRVGDPRLIQIDSALVESGRFAAHDSGRCRRRS